jgi:hypothetical protein
MMVFYVHLVFDQPQTRTSGVVRHGRRHGPSITYKITPCWVTLLQPARQASPQPNTQHPWAPLPPVVHLITQRTTVITQFWYETHCPLLHLHYTDKKENQIFLIYKESQNGAVAKSYMTNGLLIYGEIFAHFLIY